MYIFLYKTLQNVGTPISKVLRCKDLKNIYVISPLRALSSSNDFVRDGDGIW